MKIGTNVLFYPDSFDVFAKNKRYPGEDRPSAAIVTDVNGPLVDIVVFPAGRPYLHRMDIQYYTDAAENQMKYKLLDDPELEKFVYADTEENITADPAGEVSLFFEGDLETGTIVFTDKELTSLYILHGFIQHIKSGRIFQVNFTTGELTEIEEV